ncbi:MAG: hypothetical protein ACTH2Q_16615, partial [Propionibacteriaceae bacterium]
LGAAAYAIKAVRAAALSGEEARAGCTERDWQRRQLPDPVRDLVLEDQVRRNSICWFAFDSSVPAGPPRRPIDQGAPNRTRPA